MTLLIGILCKDGVVVAADSAATFGTRQFRTMEQPTRKISIIDNKVIVAGTGAVGLNQRFCDIVKRGWSETDFFQKRVQIAAQGPAFKDADQVHRARLLAAAGVNDFSQTGALSTQPGASKFGYGAIVAMPVKAELTLTEFSVDDFQPEMKDKNIWYTCMGGGITIADPLISLMREIFWQSGPPSLQSGIFAATWVMQHACAVNAGGVNEPIDIAVLERKKNESVARLLPEDELQEHLAHVEDAKDYLRKFEDIMLGNGQNVAVVPSP